MTAHHFCCILFVRTKSLGPTHIPGEGTTQECECQESWSWGAILQAASHSNVCVHVCLIRYRSRATVVQFTLISISKRGPKSEVLHLSWTHYEVCQISHCYTPKKKKICETQHSWLASKTTRHHFRLNDANLQTCTKKARRMNPGIHASLGLPKGW